MNRTSRTSQLLTPTTSMQRRQLLLLPLAAFASTLARAQESYPSKPIKVIVPFPAGGQTDVIARLFAQKAESLLGQPVVIENRPGASTIIGSDAVAKSPADGYTLLFNQTALVSNQVLQQKVPYDAFRDFTPVFRAYESAAVWAVPANGPRTLAEFIEQAKGAKASINFGTAGHGSPSHFYGEIFARSIGVAFTHIAYKGEQPILPDLVSGRLDAGVISTASAVQYGGDGRLRVLAVSGTRRMKALPNLPTFAESGVPGVAAESFVGFFAPASTPKSAVARLHEVFSSIAKMPDVHEKFLANGLEVAAPISAEQFSVHMRNARDQWISIKSSSGISLE
jgi:tripartite-type tricarboxylate transporter receptor subunit TctC